MNVVSLILVLWLKHHDYLSGLCEGLSQIFSHQHRGGCSIPVTGWVVWFSDIFDDLSLSCSYDPEYSEAQVPDWVINEVTDEEKGTEGHTLKWWHCCLDIWLLIQQTIVYPHTMHSCGKLLLAFIRSHVKIISSVKHHREFFSKQLAVSKFGLWLRCFFCFLFFVASGEGQMWTVLTALGIHLCTMLLWMAISKYWCATFLPHPSELRP